MNNEFSTIVIGCDKHIEIAQRSFLLINKFWPNILRNVIFATDKKIEITSPFFENVVVDESQSYGNRIVKALEKVASEYVLLLLDDYYLTEKIDNNQFNDIVKKMKENKILYCKLIGMPKMHKRFKLISGSYSIKQYSYYGISLQPSIWRTENLLKFLKEHSATTAWKVEADLFEFQKNNYKHCISFNKNVLKFKNGVLRGKLFPYTNKVLEKASVKQLDLERISYIDFLKFRSKQKISGMIPRKIRIFLKKIGRKKGKQYFSDN